MLIGRPKEPTGGSGDCHSPAPVLPLSKEPEESGKLKEAHKSKLLVLIYDTTALMAATCYRILVGIFAPL